MSQYVFDPFLAPSEVYTLSCNGCNRHPEDIHEYDSYAEDAGYSDNASYVKSEEGTYNKHNGHFWCDVCYVNAGMPLGVAR